MITYIYKQGYPKVAFDFICHVYGNNVNKVEYGLSDTIDQWHKWRHLNDEPYISRVLTIMAIDVLTDTIVGVILSTSTGLHEKMLCKLSIQDEQFIYNKLSHSKFIASISKIAVATNRQKIGIGRELINKLNTYWSELNRPVGLLISCVNKLNVQSISLHKHFNIFSENENNYRYFKIVDLI